jgi:hypothetical protein
VAENVDAIARARRGQGFDSSIVIPIWGGEVAEDNRLVQAIIFFMYGGNPYLLNKQKSKQSEFVFWLLFMSSILKITKKMSAKWCSLIII